MTREGEPYAAAPRPGRALDAYHEPSFTERPQTWSARSSQSKRHRVGATHDLVDAALTMPEVSGLLSITLRDGARGKREPGPANLARVLVATQRADDVETLLAVIGDASQHRAGHVAGRQAGSRASPDRVAG